MRIVLVILICLFSAVLYGQDINYFTSEKLECLVKVPSGWDIDTSFADEICLSSREYDGVILSIRRYIIEGRNQIYSEEDLLEAVMGLYHSIGIVSVNRNDIDFIIGEGRAVFNLEYVENNPGSNAIHKLLKGIIVCTEKNGQIFYLIHAEVPSDIYKIISPGLVEIISSFQITAEQLDELFPHKSDSKYIILMVVMIMAVFFYARNRRIQKSKNPLGRDSHSFWRCHACRLVNHIDNQYCQRCGTAKIVQKDPKK